ncbi:MAG: heparinase II/III family protein, partial [bacterium]|nr:heparinase II/III family protein [bacterium]
TWAISVFEGLQERIQALGSITENWAQTYIPRTTPGTPHFNMCPRCEFAPMHGAYDWFPDDPEHIRCKGCGTVYPNAEYPEDVIFHSRFDPDQIITFYGGQSWPAYGYAAIHSSFSGHARIHQCRYAANAAEDLSVMYALSGQAEYAQKAAIILKRFADVHPRYLVHSSYGEYADMAPKIAAQHVTALPENEWCPPGNAADGKLYPGYWAVLRWGSSGGMEGTSLQKLILAYDLIANTLSDDVCKHIERDLLLDSAVMLFSDHVINNKTGMNRCAVGLIGMVCGDPLLVRYGLDGFVRAVRDWWLPDGGTPESVGYAGMMLHGIWRLAEAMRGYRDPEGFDLSPGRLDHLNLYDWPRYRAIWQGMVRSLLPSFDYPLLADNRLPCHLSSMFADILVRNYPDPNHRFIQHHVAQITRCYAGRIAQFWFGGNLDTTSAFYRESTAVPKQLPEFCSDLGPHLNVGSLRAGKKGRGSVTALSAPDWKGHHHRDHLNLYYWKNGCEWLTDLGYLWDMQELGLKTRRTFAHNLVMVDEQEQKDKDRRGTFHIFHSQTDLGVMEASSNAGGASLFQRTIAVVGSGKSEYVVDIFRVRGGRVHDWVLHGPNQALKLSGLNCAPTDQTLCDLSALERASGGPSWTAAWRINRRTFSVHVPGCADETVFVGQGFGQRKAHDAGACIPYLIRRRKGPSVFVTVYAEDNAVLGVSVPYFDEKTLTAVVEIETPKGLDRVVSAGPGRSPEVLQVGRQKIRNTGRFAFVSSGGQATLIGGTQFKMGRTHLEASSDCIKGPILETFLNTHESGLVTRGEISQLSQLIGQHIFVTEESGTVRVYPVIGLTLHGGLPALMTRRGNEGYDIRVGKVWSAWRVVSTVK